MAEPLRLIALTGRAGAGKDSVAATLVRHRNYRTIAFADALREEIAAAWRIDARMLMDPATKEWDIPALALGMCGEPEFVKWRVHAFDDDLTDPCSPRWVMQRWGDWQRRSNPDHYADIVVAWLRRQVGTGWTRLLVTDVRFANELARLRDTSDRFRLVRIHRPDGRPQPARAHASETELANVDADYDLLNTGSLEDLVSATLRMEGVLYANHEVRHG